MFDILGNMIISVLQWNVLFQEDIRNIVAFLKELRPDVICLQELTVGYEKQSIQNTPDFLVQELGYGHFYQTVPIETTSGSKLNFANGIFSRFPLTSKYYTWINKPDTGGGYGDEYRAYVEVTLNVEGQPVTIGTTHMSYTHRFQETESKNKEADMLAQELQRHQDRFIFTGDLNALPGSYTLNQVGGVLNHVGPDFDQKTWATKPFSYQGFEESELNWRLDYIFATPDLKVESAKILTTQFSDHLPILATFHL